MTANPTSAPSKTIDWYRTPLAKEDFRALHVRSDFLAWCQTLGFIGLMLLTASTAWYSSAHWPWYVTIVLIFLHGTVFTFQIAGVHELGHNTVFKTKALNMFFARLFAFLDWINFDFLDTSHQRHHRYTLHVPDDLEVVLPLKFFMRDLILTGIIDPVDFFNVLKRTMVMALGGGQMKEPWGFTLFPANSPDRRRPIRWAQFLLMGHGLIILTAALTHQWMLIVLITLARFYGRWLMMLCSNTQHLGLKDETPDFRLCCRTVTMHPFVEFLYWHMNFHIEHHMYAAVPCYRLARLHQLIKHDLPPTPNGLLTTWKQIAEIQAKQKVDPTYQYVAPLPQAG